MTFQICLDGFVAKIPQTACSSVYSFPLQNNPPKNFGSAIHKYQKYVISYASYHHILAKQKITHHKNLSNTQISEMSTDSYLSRTPDKFCCMEKFKIERKNQIIFLILMGKLYISVEQILQLNRSIAWKCLCIVYFALWEEKCHKKGKYLPKCEDST